MRSEDILSVFLRVLSVLRGLKMPLTAEDAEIAEEERRKSYRDQIPKHSSQKLEGDENEPLSIFFLALFAVRRIGLAEGAIYREDRKEREGKNRLF